MVDPYGKLAEALETRLGGIAAKAVSGMPSELGTITGSGGLKLDSFKYEIPDYLVADWSVQLHFPAFSRVGTMTAPVNVKGEAQAGAVTGQWTRFDLTEAQVADVRMNWQAGLKAGDRVLAVPVNGGRDAVVLCKVVSAGG